MRGPGRKRAVRVEMAVAALVVMGLGGSLMATDGSRTIDVHYRNIKLVVNGAEVQGTAEPFIYEGRVYVPVRTVAEGLHADVQWDEAGNRVLINTAGATGAGSTAWRPFPDDNPWNQDVSQLPVDPASDQLVAATGLNRPLHPDFGAGSWDGVPMGFFYAEVPANQLRVPVDFVAYGDESDPGPYPIPPDARVEGGANSNGDRHVIVVDRAGGKLYELYRAFPVDGGTRWRADSGAIWNLRTGASRPQGWTSADAAGLPIFPGLVRYDEVAAGAIRHALRFTVPRTRRAFVPPASHWASSSTDPSLPPMGMRVRLKASVDISGFAPHNQVILRALQTYGMIVADNGSSWFLSGTNDDRWDNDELGQLKRLHGSDFEVVRMDGLVTPDTIR